MLQQSAAIIANWSIDNGMRINRPTMKTKEIIIISFCRDPVFLAYTVEPLLYDHPQNHIGVVV